MFSNTETVQVLALDGGGLKGLYTASVLKSLEDQLGHSICQHFDIITGTSTGGLIALALGRGCSAAEIQQFYLDYGGQIFPSRGVGGKYRSLRWIFANKYKNKDLKTCLQKLLNYDEGEHPLLRDSRKRLVIPTYKAGDSIPRLLKTPHDEKYKTDWKMPMWAVGMATSAAPTYLPPFEYDGKTYLDGGLWANNPSLIGVIEAKDLGADLSNIKVLNIGTTFTNSQSINSKFLIKPFTFRRAGIISWATHLLSTVMEANSYATSNMYVHQLLEKGSSFTINRQVDRGAYDLDRIENQIFTEMGATAGELNFSRIRPLFEHDAPKYTPCDEAMTNG